MTCPSTSFGGGLDELAAHAQDERRVVGTPMGPSSHHARADNGQHADDKNDDDQGEKEFEQRRMAITQIYLRSVATVVVRLIPYAGSCTMILRNTQQKARQDEVKHDRNQVACPPLVGPDRHPDRVSDHHRAA